MEIFQQTLSTNLDISSFSTYSFTLKMLKFFYLIMTTLNDKIFLQMERLKKMSAFYDSVSSDLHQIPIISYILIKI